MHTEQNAPPGNQSARTGRKFSVILLAWLMLIAGVFSAAPASARPPTLSGTAWCSSLHQCPYARGTSESRGGVHSMRLQALSRVDYIPPHRAGTHTLSSRVVAQAGFWSVSGYTVVRGLGSCCATCR